MHVYYSFGEIKFNKKLVNFVIKFKCPERMNRRINNQLPSNLIQLQNCIKRDPVGYKQEVFCHVIDDFVIKKLTYRILFYFLIVSAAI